MNFRFFRIPWCKKVIKKISLSDIFRICLSKGDGPVKKRCLNVVQCLGNFGNKRVLVDGHLLPVVPVPPSDKNRIFGNVPWSDLDANGNPFLSIFSIRLWYVCSRSSDASCSTKGMTFARSSGFRIMGIMTACAEATLGGRIIPSSSP